MKLILAAVLSILSSANPLLAQQALLVTPGGLVKCDGKTISVAEKALSKDERTFSYEGREFPNVGPDHQVMLDGKTEKYSVLEHLRLKDERLWFDGKLIDLGVKVLRVDIALRWGDRIACLGLIPHASSRWFEAKRSYALMIFSPTTGQGCFKGLYVEGKGECRLWLLDPLDKNRKASGGFRNPGP